MYTKFALLRIQTTNSRFLICLCWGVVKQSFIPFKNTFLILIKQLSVILKLNVCSLMTMCLLIFSQVSQVVIVLKAKLMIKLDHLHVQQLFYNYRYTFFGSWNNSNINPFSFNTAVYYIYAIAFTTETLKRSKYLPLLQANYISIIGHFGNIFDIIKRGLFDFLH